MKVQSPYKTPLLFTLTLWLGLLSFGCARKNVTPTASTAPAAAANSTTDAVAAKASYDLIKRIVGKYADQFVVEFIPKEGEKDVFEVESLGGKIVLRGNNGVSIASALNHYLKHYTHSSITWNGSNLNLSDKLPVVTQKVRQASPYKYRYYLNYCTFNYTMSWWDWERWQWEIDWMALNGINMPLAVTGQNAIHRRVYKSMGLTDKDLESFFSGPAYFAWFWMGNLDGWGGPLPVSWMDSHEALQKQILERQRGLGMTPILPAFTGHVPPAFKDKFPKANLKKTNWDEMFPDVYLLDPDDPMFVEIGKKFIEEEIKTFGTDHFYTSDTFNENQPPSSDSLFLNNVGQKVYQSMAAADPKATWIMQGWLFHFSRDFWQAPQIQAMLNGVPNDKMIILDLWSEKNPMWQKTEAYYGKPWIWNMLHNFGGNVNMYGLMDRVATWPAEALHHPNRGKLTGIGLTPEAIEQNPVMYELMMENAWRETPTDLTSWLKGYTHRRYGKENASANQAWEILRRTVYADSVTSGGPESIIVGRPTFNRNAGGATTNFTYNQLELVTAWDKLIAASNDLKSAEGYQFDVVDLTRQVLANYATQVQQQFAKDYKNKDAAAFKKHSAEFITLIEDLDRLVATQEDLLLGRWLNAAKAWGTTPEEKRLYEKNARNLLTLWGDKDSKLSEYANRQWAGLLNGYYKPRWQQYFSYVNSQMAKGQAIDQKAFDAKIKNWEWQWVNSTESYPDTTTGNSVAVANELYQKYHATIRNSYK
ncbi:alpha-N-acetylglucosaminidase [Rufibacter quisquiliarum]|uniref:Alpha-N-acetylglucosaminidase n=1 Tax=Rufibacter quisquiliarum TaxID=1549639 RepID=A0A839GH12_9BACT|nr:alpha-N-acetylglucosaminidase [Rufibacter quisquiliarum]MBA9076893.1 alpha-N-acetylglucosaminidase [Rufibacter quisquiliarum]